MESSFLLPDCVQPCAISRLRLEKAGDWRGRKKRGGGKEGLRGGEVKFGKVKKGRDGKTVRGM